MISKDIKIKIFAEYLFCDATNGKDIQQITLSNIEQLIDDGYKIKLKSVYDLSQDEMFEIAEEMRYRRYLEESFKDFEENQFSVSSESRNKRNLNTAMISYVAKTEDGLKGNWFRLISSFSVGELKEKGYDVGSCWSYIINGEFKERLSLSEFGLAVIY